MSRTAKRYQAEFNSFLSWQTVTKRPFKMENLDSELVSYFNDFFVKGMLQWKG